MGRHKRLKQYSVIAGGKMSKVIEFSKGEAELFVKNFIEARLSHAVIKQIGGLKDINGFFTDTNYVKTKLEKRIDSLVSGINSKLTENADTTSGGEGGTAELLTEAQKTALTNARAKLSLAKVNIQNVNDDSDFNKENIQSAKNYVSKSLDDLTANGITSLIGIDFESTLSGGEDSGGLITLNIDKENRQLKNKLNTLRKWQFDIFEEEFSAELWIGSYHEYKYSKTKEELCELISTAIKSLGAELNLNPELYTVKDNELVRAKNNSSEETINIEEDIKKALRTANIEFERIDIDWHDSNEDPESEGDDGFSYP